MSEEAEVAFEPAPEATPQAITEVTPEAALEARPEATPEATPEVTPEAALETTPQATPETIAEATPQATIEHSQSVWSAAYGEALSLLDEEKRLVVREGQNLEKLFDNLNDTNTRQKNESILRRGIRKVQNPIKFVNSAVKMASPLGGFNPTASAAFTITQSVTTVRTARTCFSTPQANWIYLYSWQ